MNRCRRAGADWATSLGVIGCLVAVVLAGGWHLAAGSAAADEWTRFRGPDGSGQSDAAGIPAQWTEKDYNWRIRLPGGGHSSPVVWKDRVFITTADPEKATQVILCVRAADGEVLWTREYESSPHPLHSFNAFASSSPAVDEHHVYVAWSNPDEVALLALTHDGRQAWRRNLGPFVSQHGFGTSPIVHDKMVILANDQGDQRGQGTSFLIAIDSRTGKDVWKTPRKTREAAYSTPLVHRPEDGPVQLIFTSGAHGLTSINPTDGKVNWEIDTFNERACSSAVFAGGHFFASCGSGAAGGNYVVAVLPPNGRDRKQPEEAYRPLRATAAPYVPGFVASGDLVFLWGDRGIVTCIRATDGQQMWQQRIGGNFFSSPIRVADKIYCADNHGVMVVIRASDKYELLARNPLGEMTHATPAVSGGVMYLRTESHLMSLGGTKKEKQ